VWAPDDASRDDPCAVLRDLAAARDAAVAAVHAEVNQLRLAGTGWPAIGRALGVTRQAVRQRYGSLPVGEGRHRAVTEPQHERAAVDPISR
jgi:hypothetical protein